MYLKKLEIQGFKSFPDKICLDFNWGITAVVGPNGSGKSNIADAVRWALGEQSAKSLRGAKMEDIIFAGTDSRRALSFAEVAITLDNSDRKINMDFSEIMVTRRVFRSGDSEYLINGATCRLKDVHELFMDTGIGKEGYSIIGQGRIEEILSTKADERRLLFEEAAGIVKYKNRKYEAEQKLLREKQNLERVDDIISELFAQLKPLEQQSEQAKTYLDLKEKLKILQINLFLSSIEKSEQEIKILEENIDLLDSQLENEKKSQINYTRTGEKIKAERVEIDQQFTQTNKIINEISIEIEQKEGNINLCHEQISSIQENVERLKSDIQSRKNTVKRNTENKHLEESKLDALDIKLAANYKNLQIQQKEFDKISIKMKESEQQIENFNSEIIQKIQEISTNKINLQSANTLYTQLESKKESLVEERDYINSRMEEKRIKIKALEKSIEETVQEHYAFQQRHQNFAGDKMIKEKALSQQKDMLGKLHKSIDECSSRLKLLNELAKDFEGYNKSVKILLKNRLNGVCGAIGELAEVPATYEICIETALGSSVQNIVTETEEDAKNAIEYLKQHKAGRATFLPLTSIKGRDFQKLNILAEKGVIDIAKNLISYNPRFENIFSSLLGRVVVIDNIENAIIFSRKYQYAYKLVTLEGELFNPGGSISGGSYLKTSSIFGRSREIKELQDKLVKSNAEKQVVSSSIEELKTSIDSLAQLIEDNRENIQKILMQKASLEQNLERTLLDLEDLVKGQQNNSVENTKIMNRIVQTNQEIRDISSYIEKLEQELNLLYKTLAEFQSSIAEDRDEKEDHIKVLMELKSLISGIEQNRFAIKENIARISNELMESQEQIQVFLSEIEGKIEIICTKEGIAEEIRNRISVLKQKRTEEQENLELLDNKKSEYQVKLHDIGRLERESLELTAKLSNENTRLNMKKEQLDAENRRRYDEIWNEYRLTHKTAQEYPRLDKNIGTMQKDEKQLKSEIGALGPINVSAIEEYKTVKERYVFISKQRDDIIIAEEKLKKIIADLKELMAQQFYEQFKIISENFSAVFKEMFSGGTAYLQLTNEQNVLETGIDIIVQPPGKKLQSMMLLSGGERALTAIALLFGILRMKPSPFCILDEIEAALDDANVVRYASYLKKFSEDTQFIVVTHRKGTMESADVLYGVTMQEHGVSKLISVKFSTNEESTNGII